MYSPSVSFRPPSSTPTCMKTLQISSTPGGPQLHNGATGHRVATCYCAPSLQTAQMATSFPTLRNALQSRFTHTKPAPCGNPPQLPATYIAQALMPLRSASTRATRAVFVTSTKPASTLLSCATRLKRHVTSPRNRLLSLSHSPAVSGITNTPPSSGLARVLISGDIARLSYSTPFPNSRADSISAIYPCTMLCD